MLRPTSPPPSPRGQATQSILTALGRFHRQVVRAREGAPQELWGDECMDQIIQATEIAASQGWRELVRALVDTGRVLQTYENAHRAHECTGFLAQSYEILCLMVGDLIEGGLRPAVWRKWKECFDETARIAATAGLALIEDDADQPEGDEPAMMDATQGYPGDGEREKDTVRSRPREEAVSPFDMAMPGSGSSSDDSLPPLDELAPLNMEGALGEEPVDISSYAWDEAEETTPEEVVEAAESPVDSDETEEDLFSLIQPDEEEESDAGVSPDVYTYVPGADFEQDLGQASSRSEAGVQEAEFSVPGKKYAPSPAVVEALDRVCEVLAQLEGTARADRAHPLTEAEACLRLLQHEAAEHARSGAVEACRTLLRMCRSVATYPGRVDDRFFELAYAFCGVYVEAGSDANDPGVRNWAVECETFMLGLEAAQPEMTPEEPFVPKDEDAAQIELPEEEDEEEEVYLLEPEEAETDSETELPESYGDELELFAIDEAEIDESEIEEPEEVEQVVETASIENDDKPLSPVSAVDEWPAAPEAAPIAAVETANPEPGDVNTPTDLLSAAQRMMTAGQSTDAKLLVLQAAGAISKAQVDEARARVALIERRIREGASALDEARNRVRSAERAVTECEENAAHNRARLDNARGAVGRTEEEIQTINQQITELEAQLLALQARREAQLSLRTQVAERLGTEHAERGQIETELTEAEKAEEAARVRLEDARQQVKDIQRKRMDVESSLERAREQLTRQMASLADIESTIEQIRSVEPNKEETSEDLLF